MKQFKSNIERFIFPLLDDQRVKVIHAALGIEAQLYLVGGTVRDALLGTAAHDIDLACSYHPEKIAQLLKDSGIRSIPTGLKHQTVTAVVENGRAAVEITSFRGPNLSPQGGVVISQSIHEDLKYRDFTVNALAFGVENSDLVQYEGALEDLELRLLRCVGNANERFTEDPLRALRLLRIACEKDFEIEAATLAAATKHRESLSRVAVERIRSELDKILLSEAPGRGFRLLNQLAFLEVILPEVARYVDFEQNEFHKADLFEHTLEVVENVPADIVLRLSALLHDVAKPVTLSVDSATGERHFYRHEAVGATMTKEILTRLRYSNEIRSAVELLVRTHMRPLRAGAGGLRRLLRDTGELYPRWRELKQADAYACKGDEDILEQEFSRFDDVMDEIKKGPPVSPLASLAVDGKDLLRTGMAEGPLVGKTLRALHERVLDNPQLNEKSLLLEMLSEVAEKLANES